MSISISTQFDREKIDHTQDYEGHLMVSMHAEDKKFTRTPISTVLVLDVSGSMSGSTQCGKSKMSLLKEVATKFVQNLTDKDEISIVTFTSDVKCILPMTKADKKADIQAAIERLEPQWSTNMSGGVSEGFSRINAKFKGVQRLMLLTDGLANVGIMGDDHDGFINLVKAKDSACTVSTFAFGNDADLDLLQALAREGGGNFYYIKDADISSIFARELGGIASCMGQNIKIKVAPSDKNEVVEVLNDFNIEDENGVATISADDIYAEESKHILVKMKLNKANGKLKDRAVTIAKVIVSYDDLKSGKREKTELSQKIQFVKPADADKETVLIVEEQVAGMKAAKAQVEAVQRANVGDWTGAKTVLEEAGAFCGLCANRGSDYADSLSGVVFASVDNFKQDTYNMSYGNTVRAAASNYSRMKAGSGSAVMGSLGEIKRTLRQKKMEANFQGSSPSTTTPQVPFPSPVPVNDPEKTEEDTAKKKKGFSKSKTRKR